MSNKKLVYVFLMIIYGVGLVGIILPEWRELVLPLTPFNLLLTLGALVYVNRPLSGKSISLMAVIFLIGFLVEVAGVATGILFGQYEYGNTLGYMLFDVPLVIGVNWLFLSICTHAITNRITTDPFILVPTAALLMVLLDVLVEPVAIRLDFWQWQGDIIPIQNYIMWFITASLIHLLMFRFKIRWDFGSALFVFGLQLAFFVALNFVL